MTEAKLAEALGKAQAEFAIVKKDKTAKVFSKRTNKEFTYSYADFANVVEVARVVLHKHGLAFTQIPVLKDGAFILNTHILHTSGEAIMGEWPLQNDASPQEMGSALTYAKRYSLCAMLGIVADEDDDGQAGNDTKVKAPIVTPEQAKAAIAAKKNLITYALNSLDGAVPSTFATPASFLTALGKGLKDADDPIAYWEANYDVFQGIEEVAKAQFDEGLVERCKKAQAYANERAAALNGDLKGAGMP